MMTQGDPLLIMTGNGTRINFIGGQPAMDRGLINLALISLFTRSGWCGNKLMKEPIGSEFEETCNQPVTLRSLNLIRQAAEKALKNPAFGSVQVAVTNPNGMQIRLVALLSPPGENPQELVLTKSGQNWIFQAQYQEQTGRGGVMLFEDGVILGEDDGDLES